MQFARRIIAEAGKKADCLHGGEAAHQAAHRAKYALCCAVVAIIWVMRVTDETAVAGAIRMPPGKGAYLAVKLTDGGADQWYPRGDTKVVDDQASRKIIAAVDYDIDIM